MDQYRAKLALVITLAGVSIAAAVLLIQLAERQPATSGVPEGGCAEMFAPGQEITVDRAEVTCTDPSGAEVVLMSLECRDGRRLWQIEAVNGVPAGWGFTGEAFHVSPAGDLTLDLAYGHAYAACYA